jgi:hypothetical protein
MTNGTTNDMDQARLDERSALATRLKYSDDNALDLALTGAKGLAVPFPAGLAPTVVGEIKASTSLPGADVVVMCDTVAEAKAMSDVLSPGHEAPSWTAYTKNYAKLMTKVGPRGPAHHAARLGSYIVVTLDHKRVLLYKTELHMHEDAERQPDGTMSLPIKDALKQIIADARPDIFLTTGTSGGVYAEMPLGDVVVSRAARFACKRDFAHAAYNNKTFESRWKLPTGRFADAQHLMAGFAAHLTGKTPPSDACCAPATGKRVLAPVIHCDGMGGIPAMHPILTTDYFEFGTDENRLDKVGMAVEMDDACLGLACSELTRAPQWACVRNVSDPVINGKLAPPAQDKCAEFYYLRYGYWTSVNSALAAWALICAL